MVTLLDPMRFGTLLDDLRKASSDAQQAFDAYSYGRDPDWYDSDYAAYSIEEAFLKLLAALEALDIRSLREMLIEDIERAKSTKDGFAASRMGPEEPYSTWMGRYSQYLAAIETLAPPAAATSITKDIVEILRASLYSITDERLFDKVPSCEDDVHRRIEGVLRCVFPDLRTKPPLSKPIKNFIPDTGLPSIGTLIEFKFIDDANRVPDAADEILADTRGYVSAEWHTFIYVIYETKRFKLETQWNALLRAADVPESTSVVVLSGESSRSPRTRARSAVRSKAPTKTTNRKRKG